jgi:1,6-anhydro-N-acetylmuramate kinase
VFLFLLTPAHLEFDYDTPASVVKAITWEPSDLSQSSLYPPYFHIPAPESLQRTTPEEKELAARARAVQDAYIRGETSPSVPMEQYLARELANPHSRARKQERWEQTKEERDKLRVRFMKAAKEARSMGGKCLPSPIRVTQQT